ncbi:MAG: hypothetical protein BWY32_02261 [bacterium ADurb.Bin243]|nr:MAG: hypothetical protein BWY32_02261 [bacterium ADurb.Bin243]
MGLLGFIGGCIGALGSAIMGSAIVQAAISLGTTLAASIMAMSLPQILLCVYICVLIAKELGILGPEQDEKTVEDLGDRAIQAREKGIKPENYKTYEEYLKAIENFETDPVRSSNISWKRKLDSGLSLLLTLINIKSPDSKSIIEMFVKGVAPKIMPDDKNSVLTAGVVDEKMKWSMMELAKNYFATLKDGGAGVKELAEFIAQKNESPEIYDAKMKADKELKAAIDEINKGEKKS